MNFKSFCTTTTIILILAACLISHASAEPLDNWHVRAPFLTTSLLHSIAYGNGMFVAVGNWSTILTSPDGINWTKRASPSNVHEEIRINGITFGNGIFVAVGDIWDSFGFPRGFVILRSVDGENWTAQFPSERLVSVAYGNGSFVAVGSWVVASSQDGLQWGYTAHQAEFGYITFGNGMFLALGSRFPDTWYPSAEAAASLDGISWNFHPITGSGNQMGYFGLAYGHSNAVVVGAIGCYGFLPCAGQEIITSPDMVHWTYRITDRSTGWGSVLNAISYGMGSFVAVGESEIVMSSDGVNWKYIDLPNVPRLTAITHGGNTFVAVGENGTILQSDPIPYVNEAVGVPTLSEWSMLLFMVMAGLGAIFNLRNQKRVS